ncbi:hypothetical protein ABFX02_06G157000 [Erythranthe guttata]
MANPDLPEDILLEIFSQLPAKSIGKCSLIFISESLAIHTIDKIEYDAVSRPIEIKPPQHKWYRVVGSCDGLVLLQTNESGIFLLNPVTLQLTKVPPATEKTRNTHKYGFGYDSSIDEYKIVEAVKRRIWKRVDDSPYIPCPLGRNHGAFLNGAIHWLADKLVVSGDGYSTIAAFDLACEVFDEIPLPSGISLEQIVWRCELVVFDSCLCLVESKWNSENDLWTMKEYGVAESWAKFSFRGIFCWKYLKPVCYIEDGEIMLLSSSENLDFYNLKERTMRDDIVDSADVYVESLVSLTST